MPAGADTSADDEDPAWKALVDANTAEDGVDGGGRRVSLDVALLHCEDALGAGWVCCPPRWGAGPHGTLDGCVPVRVVWARFASLGMRRASFAMDTARGIGLGLGGKDGASNLDRAMDDAYPDR